MTTSPGALPTPTRAQIKRWQRYLANERAEAAVYRELAHNKDGEEREILLSLAAAEARHEEYWRSRLGDYVGMPRRPDYSTLLMGFLAKRFGSVFTLALMQSAEARSPYAKDEDASAQMLADERIHAEVVRGLAARSREKMSGSFRAAVFGLNDGLVSNLALVLAVVGSGASQGAIVLTGFSGLLAGALSMAAGEYVSVSSQRELLAASTPHEDADNLVPQLDVNANELSLVYRARGMGEQEADQHARAVLAGIRANHPSVEAPITGGRFSAAGEEAVGSALGAAGASFCLFAAGAFVPLIPFLFGVSTAVAATVACVLVGLTLMATGGIVGILSGTSPVTRALRQLAIGLGASAVTYGLGSAFGAVL
ncbi:VIT1/CCC1 transporter family protein [Corynebacterium aquilae]|uniref:Membrane protein n=1 Tax=Corynebacterium aquilae DSM 44791 TaxID=1431546 RepID=A0A1L7CH63_9CORY|nr:VIT1/CCC1 transporter family protein [Corynebacterium aquilae]APT85188.1 membrane protein [Corynebacterium aquilae DSM 44791]